MAKKNSISKRELELQLATLKKEYRLARLGLLSGSILTGMATVGMVLIKFTPAVIAGLLSGGHIVLMVLILAFVVIIYFSFVFGRAAKLRAQITEKEKLLEMVAGEKVR